MFCGTICRIWLCTCEFIKSMNNEVGMAMYYRYKGLNKMAGNYHLESHSLPYRHKQSPRGQLLQQAITLNNTPRRSVQKWLSILTKKSACAIPSPIKLLLSTLPITLPILHISRPAASSQVWEADAPTMATPSSNSRM